MSKLLFFVKKKKEGRKKKKVHSKENRACWKHDFVTIWEKRSMQTKKEMVRIRIKISNQERVQ